MRRMRVARDRTRARSWACRHRRRHCSSRERVAARMLEGSGRRIAECAPSPGARTRGARVVDARAFEAARLPGRTTSPFIGPRKESRSPSLAILESSASSAMTSRAADRPFRSGDRPWYCSMTYSWNLREAALLASSTRGVLVVVGDVRGVCEPELHVDGERLHVDLEVALGAVPQPTEPGDLVPAAARLSSVRSRYWRRAAWVNDEARRLARRRACGRRAAWPKAHRRRAGA